MSALARFNGLAGRALWAVQRLVNGPRFLKTLTAFEAGAERGLKYGTPALAGLTIALLVEQGMRPVLLILIGVVGAMAACYFFFAGAAKASRSLGRHE